MSDGTITYDYDVLEECLAMMSSKAQAIQDQADGLESDVKRIMVDWTGSTADAYQQLATDLDNDLIANRGNLDTLTKTLQGAADAMQQQDKSGAGGMGR
jgi:WXG100 family type VII secretion target